MESEEHLSEMQQKLIGKEDDLVNTNKKAESLEIETQTLRVFLDETVQKLKEKENVLQVNGLKLYLQPLFKRIKTFLIFFFRKLKLL